MCAVPGCHKTLSWLWAQTSDTTLSLIERCHEKVSEKEADKAHGMLWSFRNQCPYLPDCRHSRVAFRMRPQGSSKRMVFSNRHASVPQNLSYYYILTCLNLAENTLLHQVQSNESCCIHFECCQTSNSTSPLTSTLMDQPWDPRWQTSGRFPWQWRHWKRAMLHRT